MVLSVFFQLPPVYGAFPIYLVRAVAKHLGKNMLSYCYRPLLQPILISIPQVIGKSQVCMDVSTSGQLKELPIPSVM